MFILLFAFWLLLNGHWTTEIAIVGLVLCGLIYLLIWKFFGYSPKREWRLFRRLPHALFYLFWLVGEIFRSAFHTMHFIWSAREIVEPELVSFRPRIRTKAGRVILADSITMTPGTITVSLDQDQYLVHCLDSSFAEGIEDNEMVHRVQHLEGGNAHD